MVVWLSFGLGVAIAATIVERKDFKYEWNNSKPMATFLFLLMVVNWPLTIVCLLML